MRHFLSFAFSVVFLGVFACSSHAAIVVSNGDVQMHDPLGTLNPAPLEHITRLSLSSGRVYTNQIDGTPFAVGSTVRTVGIFTIGGAINGTNTPALLPDNSNLNIIFALEGTIESGGTIVTAEFSQGRAYLVSDTTGNALTFSIDSAASWNFANAFAEFTLLQQQDVVDGAPFGVTSPAGNPTGGVSFLADTTNKSAVNTSAVQQQQGIFLFGEDSTSDQNSGNGFVDPGVVPFSGDDFLRNVAVAPLYPYPKGLESVVPVTNQTAKTSFIAPSAADILALNAIFQDAFGVDFSSGLPGDPTLFTPSPLGIGTGDFVADLGGEVYVGYEAVPEPASMLVWSGLSVVGLGLAAARKRRLAAKSA